MPLVVDVMFVSWSTRNDTAIYMVLEAIAAFFEFIGCLPPKDSNQLVNNPFPSIYRGDVGGACVTGPADVDLVFNRLEH